MYNMYSIYIYIYLIYSFYISMSTISHLHHFSQVRMVLYFIGLIYSFMGVSIATWQKFARWVVDCIHIHRLDM